MTQGDIFSKAQIAKVNMLPRLYIDAIDRPTVLYRIYCAVSVQQTNLLPKNASQNNAILPKVYFRRYRTTS